MKWLFFFLPLLPSMVLGSSIYVSPSGSDQNSGKSREVSDKGNGPLASIEMALKRAREMRAGFDPVTVVLLPGYYLLERPLALSAPDGGDSESKPLTIQAEKPGSVTIGSAYSVSDWIANPAGYWVARTKTDRRFQMIWIDGKLGVRARAPKVGSFYIGGKNVKPPVKEAKPFTVTHPNNIENTRSVILPPDAQAELRKLQAQGGLGGAFLTAYHSWTTSTHRIVSYDSESGAVTLTPESKWPFLRFGPDQRFVIENLPELLDEPGEWWVSSEGELRYKPRAGETIAKTAAMVPRLERLLEINGSPDAPVQNIKIKGLRFSHTLAWTSPMIDNQAATGVPAAVVGQYMKNISFENCSFEHIGGYALWLRKGSKNNSIEQSVFKDLGAGGIRIGEAQIPVEESDKVSGNTIRNNLIVAGGRIFPAGVGIWIGQSSENSILDNEIGDFYYTGISLGWTWGSGPSAAFKNRVEQNYIHDLGQGVLSDLGGIYTLGKSAGTIIKNNRIEDVSSFSKKGATAWGIYLDEGTSEVVVEGNQVMRNTGGGFHLHYGDRNIVRKNTFGYGKIAQMRLTGNKNSVDNIFEDNDLIEGGGASYDGDWSAVKQLRNKILKKEPAKRQKSLPAGIKQQSVFEK